VRRALSSLAERSGAAIVVPYFLEGPDESASVVVTAGGRFTASQPKRRPMWFLGEHAGDRATPSPVDAGGVPVGTTLGVDNQEPRPVRELAAADAALVSSSTHDWKQLAPHQRALSRLHALESGLPVVRSDWRYGSAIVEADGAVVAGAGDGKRRTVLVADVRRGSGGTPYAEIGDVLAWIAAAVGLCLLLAGVLGGLLAGRVEGILGGALKGRASRARAASPRSRRPAPSSPA
jgi:predicted amidohydrolase